MPNENASVPTEPEKSIPVEPVVVEPVVAVPQPTLPAQKQFSNTRYQLKLALIGLVLLLGIAVVYQNRELYIHNPQIRPYLPEVLLASPQPSPQPSMQPSPSPEERAIPRTGEQFILQRKDDSGAFQDLATIEPEQVTRWKDVVIYRNLDVARNLELLGLDLTSMETKPVATMSADAAGFKELGTNLTSLAVINDDLYISIGGYMVNGALYWMNLNTLSTPEKIATTHNARVVQKDGRYFVMGGEGDGCGGANFISLLDPTNHTIREVVNTSEGCNLGIAFIAQTPQSIYLSTHIENDREVISPEVFTLYTDLQELNIDSGQKSTLISAEDMPIDTTDVSYYEDYKKFLITGKNVGIFDPETKKYTNLKTFEDKWLYVSVSRTLDTGVCISKALTDDQATELSKTFYRINMEQGTMVEDAEGCQLERGTTTQYFDGLIKTASERLNLPSDYRIVHALPQDL